MDQTINKHTTKNPPAPLRSASPFIKGDLENIPKRGIFAFTLVELIVVVTILAILATIGFVSYSSYLTGVRDTNRLAQLVSIHDGLELYRTKKDLPLPDESVDVIIGSDPIAYQGTARSNTLETIDFTKGGLDPRDKSYFSYYLTADRKYFQLMAFLEEEANITSLTPSSSPLEERGVYFASLYAKGEGIQGGGLFIFQTQAIDYSSRIPTIYGKKLGILTNDQNTPIQEIQTIKDDGELDISATEDTSGYIAHLSDTSMIEGTATDSPLQYLGNISKSGGSVTKSCKQLLEKTPSLKGKDGAYMLDPSGGNPELIYCDMTTEGGGWTYMTLVSDGTADENMFMSDNTEKIIDINQTGQSTKGQISEFWTSGELVDFMLVCRVANSLFENYENPTIIYDAPYSVLEDLISDDWTGKKMFGGLDYTGCGESGIVRDGVGANSAGSPGPFNIYMHNMNNERFLHHWRSYTMYSGSSDVGCAATLGGTYETFSGTNYCMSAIR